MDFILKARGLGAALRPQVGPGRRPGGVEGAKSPEAPEF